MQRSDTCFFKTGAFDKAVNKLREPGRARILSRANEFEQVWNRSKSDEDISPGFRLDQLAHKKGRYRVIEIRVANWRIALMVLEDVSRAYWIHTWRKTGQRNPQDVDLAVDRAKTLYEHLK